MAAFFDREERCAGGFDVGGGHKAPSGDRLLLGADALRLGWPSSRVAGAVEQQRTRCGEAAVAESASDVTTMHLLLMEDRAMDLHGKH